MSDMYISGNIMITGECVSGKCRERLVSLGFTVIRLTSFRALPRPVSSHPDMLLYRKDGVFLTFQGYKAEAERLLSAFGARFEAIPEQGGSVYPLDIPLNALEIGDTVYANEKSLSESIKKDAKRVVNIRQGYARCSTALVSPKAAITADKGIASALKADGVDVLEISPGGIRLDGYGYGFIGGCSGNLGNGLYAFCGDIEKHPDGRAIVGFCEKHGVNAVSLSDEPLCDCGGLLIL
ncbi:MAG: hypothetical protein PUE85_05620 [Firmicutes bacterium]|nr:hypothetical protein [Bacillota bacterium]